MGSETKQYGFPCRFLFQKSQHSAETFFIKHDFYIETLENLRVMMNSLDH